jgi:hypothetical protein
MPTQVSSEHYTRREYDTKGRWTSYWHQADEVLRTGAKRCLEIGGGSGVVRAYLELRDVEVVTVDFAADLRPDRVGDVRALPCADGEFDAALCCQVLEHIPFDDVPTAVSELARVTSGTAIVSIPQSGRYVELRLRIPPFKPIGGVAKLPGLRRFEPNEQHHWEAGTRDYPLRKVRGALTGPFACRNEYLVREHPYHRFFVLDRR